MPDQEIQPDTSSKHYLLPPDICLTFTGDDYLARQAIEFMFDFCKPLEGPVKKCANQIIARISINSDYMSSPLPDWINKQIVEGRQFDHVHIFYGPDREAAALLSNHDGFVCGLLNSDGNQIDITLGKTKGQQTMMMSPSAIFTPLIQEALQRRDNLIFHSAGLRLENGTGLMILADSGGGKTTTALSLLRKKASMLADDLVILTLEKGKPVIHGIPEPLNITAATRNFFPELSEASSLPSRDGVTDKVVFDPRTVYGDQCLGGKSSLHVIYFTQVTSGEPTISRVSHPAALGKLIKGCTFAFNQKLSRASGSTLFDLAEKIPCFTLQTGSDPDYLGTWLQEQSALIASGIRP